VRAPWSMLVASFPCLHPPCHMVLVLSSLDWLLNTFSSPRGPPCQPFHFGSSRHRHKEHKKLATSFRATCGLICLMM
jgi:hypothetical protein